MLNSDHFSEEELSLLNPAYTGFLLYSSIREFSAHKAEGMHCALPFILTPMAVNKYVSGSLPKMFKTPIGVWAAENEGPVSDLHLQASAYNPVVKAALSFLMDKQLLTLTDNGYLQITGKELVKNPGLFSKSADMKEALRVAKFLGRWFSHAPSVETIFAQLGLRP